MKRAQIIGIILGSVAIVALIIVAVILCWPQKFSLSPQYYEDTGFHDIDTAGLQQLINDKTSFALLIWQPACQTSADFEQVVKDFSEQNHLSLEKINFTSARKSGLVGELKYYPSVALYREGKLVTFLDADSDEFLEYYKSVEGFSKWWEKYIKDRK